MHLGATIRLLRIDAGLSLRDLARRIGVSSAYLSRVEHGLDAVPTPERLSAIARELDVPPTVLMDVAHRVNPFVASYLEQEPGAGALFLDVARRQLAGPQLARVREFLEREFPAREARWEVPAAPLAPLLTPERIILQLSCAHLDDALDVVAGRLAAVNPSMGAARLAAALRRREEEASSAVGNGVVVPHALVAGWPSPTAALVTLAQPLKVDTPDGQPLRLVVVLVNAPDRSHLVRMAHLARLASHGLAHRLGGCQQPSQVLEQLATLESCG
jgi:PTS system nitrogen regulatory IIA component